MIRYRETAEVNSVNNTRALCEFLVNLTPDIAGEENMLDIRYRTLDWLGCSIAAKDLPCAEAVSNMITTDGGNAQASAVGLVNKTTAQQAAFYNGIISHALEYDDTNKIAITHPGAPVIAAALAISEMHQASFEEYAMGVVVGYEAMMRLGAAANPEHYKYWHTTGTCGTFAAAAAAGKIMGLCTEQMETAFGFASTMASGLVYVFGTDAKLLTVGNAARNGIVAAELAFRNLSAPKDAFSGKEGYAVATGSKKDLSFMVPQKGDALMLEDAYYKMHASCGHTHSALDALQELLANETFTSDDIEKIEVQVYQKAYELCGLYQTSTTSKAKFSLPYCLAVMLLYGKCTLAEFVPEIRTSSVVEAYAKRITIKESVAYTATYPKFRTEKLSIWLKSGGVLEKSVDLPEGRPSHAFLDQKFLALSEMTITHEKALKIHETVLSIKKQEPISIVGNEIRNLRRVSNGK